MAQEQITARSKAFDGDGNPIKDDDGNVVYNSCEVSYDFGDTLDEAIEMVGTDVVFSQYISASRIALQNVVRAKMAAGVNAEQIQEIVNTWKPGMVLPKTSVDPKAALKALWPTWSDEEKRNFLEGLELGDIPL